MPWGSSSTGMDCAYEDREGLHNRTYGKMQHGDTRPLRVGSVAIPLFVRLEVFRWKSSPVRIYEMMMVEISRIPFWHLSLSLKSICYSAAFHFSACCLPPAACCLLPVAWPLSLLLAAFHVFSRFHFVLIINFHKYRYLVAFFLRPIRKPMSIRIIEEEPSLYVYTYLNRLRHFQFDK